MSGGDWKDSVSEEIHDLVEWLISQGHSVERAVQIGGNHPEAVRAEMEKAKAVPPADEAPTAEVPAVDAGQGADPAEERAQED